MDGAKSTAEEFQPQDSLEATLETGRPGHNPRNEAVPADAKPEVAPLPDPPARHEQDTQPVDGAAAIDPPPGTELIQRTPVQG